MSMLDKRTTLMAQIARRHGFSVEAVQAMLSAVTRGHGSMAQFNHPEFGGLGQWMRGGMTMISGVGYGDPLQHRVDLLCQDIAEHFAADPDRFATAEIRGSAPGPARDHGRTAWWPTELGAPGSTGDQGDFAYAYFPALNRLAVRNENGVTVYATEGYVLTGFAQRQPGGSIEVSTDEGIIALTALPITYRSPR